MCLLAAIYQSLPDCPLLILANRDEFYARPSTPPQLVASPTDPAAWLGGLDPQAGGTWLGVNRFGLVAAVTNRSKQTAPALPVGQAAGLPAEAGNVAPAEAGSFGHEQHLRSRGLLCRDLLGCRSAEEARREIARQLERHRFAGFNLAVFTVDSAFIVEAGDEIKISPLQPGVHIITNGLPDDPQDLRIQRTKTELELILRNAPKVAGTLRVPSAETARGSLKASSPRPSPLPLSQGERGFEIASSTLPSAVHLEQSLASAMRICGLHQQHGSPPICLHDDNRGTVSSTVIALTNDPSEVRYFFAPGPPCFTPFDDDSPRLKQLLRPHRMHLKGPWQYEWLETSSEGSGTFHMPSAENDDNQEGTELPPGRVRMPAPWRSLFGERAGTIRFRRRFGRPTNLEPHERVYLVFDGINGHARVLLNGQPLGTIPENRQTAAFEMTQLPERNNEVAIELTFDPALHPEQAGGLWGPVALEIRAW